MNHHITKGTNASEVKINIIYRYVKLYKIWLERVEWQIAC